MVSLLIFESVWYNLAEATVAQLAEQTFRKRQVKGPNPFGGSFILTGSIKLRQFEKSTCPHYCVNVSRKPIGLMNGFNFQRVFESRKAKIVFD